MSSMFGLFRRREPPKPASAPPPAQRVLSLLRPEDISALGGLPAQAICGLFVGEDSSEASFRPNRTFVDFLHQVIASAGPADLSLRSAAKAEQNGCVYIIDLRTPEGPQGRAPPEDIVGAFKVENGVMVEGSYWTNAKHKVFTQDGLVRLPPSLHATLIAALMSCEVEPAPR
jgi:hypothetical protein